MLPALSDLAEAFPPNSAEFLSDDDENYTPDNQREELLDEVTLQTPPPPATTSRNLPLKERDRATKAAHTAAVNSLAAAYNNRFHITDEERQSPAAMPLAPPPEDVYPTRQAAQDSLLAWSLAHGYGYRILRSKPSGHKRPQDRFTAKVTLCCDLFYEHESVATKFKTTSRGCGCLHSVRIVNKKGTKDNDETGEWQVKVDVAGHVKIVKKEEQEPESPTHKVLMAHRDFLNASAHPVHRRRSAEVVLRIRRLIDEGMPPGAFGP